MECLEPFDVGLTKQCLDVPTWKPFYYFDADIRSCRMYWHDGCRSHSRNNFENLETCQWKCEGRHPAPEGSRS